MMPGGGNLVVKQDTRHGVSLVHHTQRGGDVVGLALFRWGDPGFATSCLPVRGI